MRQHLNDLGKRGARDNPRELPHLVWRYASGDAAMRREIPAALDRPPPVAAFEGMIHFEHTQLDNVRQIARLNRMV